MRQSGPMRKQHLAHPACEALVLLLMLLANRCWAVSRDQKVLLDFKDSQALLNCTESSDYGSEESDDIFTSWSADSSKWAGVTFRKDEAVSELRLNSTNLCGMLPESFGRLSGLTHLDLSSNALTGTLPESFGSLSGLTLLDLSDNHFHGMLPVSFSSLTKLAFLDLNSNENLTGPMPTSFSKLVSLTYLDLLWNNFSTMPEPLSNMVSLRHLTVASNGMTGPLPVSFSKLVRLTFLQLADNELTGPLPASWSVLVHLSELSLTFNRVTGTVPEYLSKLVSLSELRLSENNLTGPLPESFSALTRLTQLEMHTNNLTGTLPRALSKMTQLADLSLYGNQFTGPLPEFARSMESLALTGNSFTGTLPAAWSKMVRLEELYLGLNQLHGPLPAAWSSMNSMTSLTLSDNHLTGTLPETWGALLNLGSLDLSNNSLMGTIPHALGKLLSLSELDLSKNGLTGTIPHSMSMLLNLDSLQLSANKFTGPLPTALTNVATLRAIDLSSNRLTGPLPSVYSKLTGLYSLFLSANSITGSLPDAWSVLTDLWYLGLGSNPFSPQPMCHSWMNGSSFWDGLRYIDMSNMHLTGPLPAIPNSFSVTFNLSYNSLTGSVASIPEEVVYLSLASNQLTGSIPAVNSTNLVYLDVTNNRLSQLPLVFEAPNATFFSAANNRLSGSIIGYVNHSLAYCDLRNNSLTGTIPQAWTAHGWGFLALSYNILSGQLPDMWKGDMSVLLLHNNSFSGCLPKSWQHNNSMVILSLSNNTLGCALPEDYASDQVFQNLIAIYLDGNRFTGLIPVGWLSGFIHSNASGAPLTKTVLYLGSKWRQSSEESQAASWLPSSGQNWRKDICLSKNLNDRLNVLSRATVPPAVQQQLQKQLDTRMVIVKEALERGGPVADLTFELPPVMLQLSTQPQLSAEQICANTNASKIVLIMWASMACLLTLMAGLYALETRFRLFFRPRHTHAALRLHLTERVPCVARIGRMVVRLVGTVFYWFDVVTDIYLLYQVFGGQSLWAPWVLLGILLLHYIIGAMLLTRYFSAKRQYCLVVFVLLVPAMPLVDTVAAVMSAAAWNTSRDATRSAFLDWQAVFQLRHALEFLLESIPMAITQTAIYLAGNSPRSGVYLDDNTYILSASAASIQILGMAGLLFFTAARERESLWQVLRGHLMLPTGQKAEGEEKSPQCRQAVQDGLDAL